MRDNNSILQQIFKLNYPSYIAFNDDGRLVFFDANKQDPSFFVDVRSKVGYEAVTIESSFFLPDRKLLMEIRSRYNPFLSSVLFVDFNKKTYNLVPESSLGSVYFDINLATFYKRFGSNTNVISREFIMNFDGKEEYYNKEAGDKIDNYIGRILRMPKPDKITIHNEHGKFFVTSLFNYLDSSGNKYFKYGLKDDKDKILIQPNYNMSIKFPYNKGDKLFVNCRDTHFVDLYVLDTIKREITKLDAYDNVNVVRFNYNKYYAIVKKGPYYGIIGTDGKYILEPKYSSIVSIENIEFNTFAFVVEDANENVNVLNIEGKSLLSALKLDKHAILEVPESIESENDIINFSVFFRNDYPFPKDFSFYTIKNGIVLGGLHYMPYLTVFDLIMNMASSEKSVEAEKKEEMTI